MKNYVRKKQVKRYFSTRFCFSKPFYFRRCSGRVGIAIAVYWSHDLRRYVTSIQKPLSLFLTYDGSFLRLLDEPRVNLIELPQRVVHLHPATRTYGHIYV